VAFAIATVVNGQTFECTNYVGTVLLQDDQRPVGVGLLGRRDQLQDAVAAPVERGKDIR
jgi:hypothetical protein